MPCLRRRQSALGHGLAQLILQGLNKPRRLGFSTVVSWDCSSPRHCYLHLKLLVRGFVIVSTRFHWLMMHIDIVVGFLRSAKLLVPNEGDEATREMIVAAILPTAVYCFLQAVQCELMTVERTRCTSLYPDQSRSCTGGFWSVLEGQARVTITSAFVMTGWWLVVVPLCFVIIRVLHADSDEADPCSEPPVSGTQEMQWIMWSHAAGFLVCDVMMAYSVFFCDWQALSDEAVANAAEDEEDEGDEDEEGA